MDTVSCLHRMYGRLPTAAVTIRQDTTMTTQPKNQQHHYRGSGGDAASSLFRAAGTFWSPDTLRVIPAVAATHQQQQPQPQRPGRSRRQPLDGRWWGEQRLVRDDDDDDRPVHGLSEPGPRAAHRVVGNRPRSRGSQVDLVCSSIVESGLVGRTIQEGTRTRGHRGMSGSERAYASITIILYSREEQEGSVIDS